MCELFLTEQGTKVRCKGRRLVVTREKEQLFSCPIHRIDRLVLMGRIQISASALALLLDRSIPLIFTTSRGRIRGSLNPPLDPAVNLRIAQYALAQDTDYCRAFSLDLVRAKGLSSMNILRRYAYNHPSETLRTKAAQIRDHLQTLSEMDIDSLRGHEGLTARMYFEGLVEIFSGLGIGFEGRIRRPPRDPVNAVMSYIYVILTGHVTMLLQTTGLDPFLGLMHKPNRSAPALALDLVEQFRQPIADRFIMLMFNNRVLTSRDFAPQGALPAAIIESSKKRLLGEWDKFLNQPQNLIQGRDRLSPTELIKMKIHEFREAIRRKKPYENFALSD